MRSCALAVAFALTFAVPLRAQDRQVVQVPGALSRPPFSSAIRTGNLLFVSGQIGDVPGTRQLAPGGIAAGTRQAPTTRR